MKKMLSFFAVLIMSSLQTHTITQEQVVQNNVTQIAQTLSPDELQFFANVTYSWLHFAVKDLYVRINASGLLDQCLDAQRSIQEYGDTQELVKQMSSTATTLAAMLHARNYAYKQWQATIQAIDQVGQTTNLAKAIEIYTNHVQHTIRAYVEDSKTEFENALITNQEALNNYHKEIGLATQLLNSLVDGQLPIETEPQDKQVMLITMANQTACFVESQCRDMLENTQDLMNYQVSIEEASILILHLYYDALYQEIQKLEPHMRTVLFDAQGLLDIEKRVNALPQSRSMF